MKVRFIKTSAFLEISHDFEASKNLRSVADIKSVDNVELRGGKMRQRFYVTSSDLLCYFFCIIFSTGLI